MEFLTEYFTFDRFIEFTGFFIGILYLYWEYKADNKMWFASIVMPIMSFWVYYRAGLYADFCMNIYYFVIAIYGYFRWTKNEHTKSGKQSVLKIRHIGYKTLALLSAIFILVYSAIFIWLNFFTDSNVPVFDAFTTALSIVAMWMLAQKYIEQWIAWILVDAVTTLLCVYKDRPFYAILYGIYTLVAVFGYIKWKRLMKEERFEKG